MPGGPVVSKATALDDLGVLQEERSGALGNIGTTEAQLRSEIFDRERDNDKVRYHTMCRINESLCDRSPQRCFLAAKSNIFTSDTVGATTPFVRNSGTRK